MKPDDCILFSGGATGAEAEFGACAERRGIQEQSLRRRLNGRASHIGPQISRHSSSPYGSEVNRCLRKPATDVELRRYSPLLEQRAFPAAEQRTAADAYAGCVLRLHAELMPLIETRTRSLGAKIEPVLRDRGATRVRRRNPARHQWGVVERASVGVLPARGGTAAQPAPQRPPATGDGATALPASLFAAPSPLFI